MKHLFLILLLGLFFACSDDNNNDDDQNGNNLPPDIEEPSTDGISFASPEETLKAIEGTWKYWALYYTGGTEAVVDSIGYEQGYDYTKLIETRMQFSKDKEAGKGQYDLTTDIDLGFYLKSIKFKILREDEKVKDSPYTRLVFEKLKKFALYPPYHDGGCFKDTIYVMEVKADQMILERRDAGNQKHTIFKRAK